MLKTDVRLWREPLEAIVYPAVFFALGSWLFQGLPPWQAFLSAGVFWALRIVILAVRRFRGLWRAERLRQAASRQAPWIPLAWPQPESGLAALPLPRVIFSRPGWPAYVILPFLVWGLIVFALSWFWSADGPFVNKLIFSACLALPLSMIGLADYKRIEVREEGLTIRTLFSRKSIHWQDARLFAIDTEVKPDKIPDQYELSSATTILRWSRELKPSRLQGLSTTFPEYAQQMDGLLALICARTGLPLYDLRDWGSQKQVPPGYLPPPIPQYPPPFSPDGQHPNVPNA